MKRNIRQNIEHDDDIPVGKVLNRREMLALMAGVAGSLVLVGCGDISSPSPAQSTNLTTQASSTTSSPATTQAASSSTTASATTQAASTASAGSSQLSCVVVPALTEGPYFVDEKLNRSDIRVEPSDNSVKEGVILKLTFNVSQVTSSGCSAYAGAYVDVWHCDALGVYSDVVDTAEGFNTKGQKFLRGYQVTDANGKVEFTTIYPGWYQGRTVHIHFKIRNQLNATQAHTFTSQLFFDDTITDQVHAQSPYSTKGQRTLRNSGDGIYRQGGSQLLLTPTKEGNGYTATFNLGVQI
jgi:protocatechuate 3,4-dioxygenase beta subunit